MSLEPRDEIENERLLLARLMCRWAVKRGEFTLASGQKSSVYVDARVVVFTAIGARLIGRQILHRLDRDTHYVGGLELGAVPVVAATLAACGEIDERQQGVMDFTGGSRPKGIHGFVVRKQAKENGTSRKIEGADLQGGKRVAVVEDVTTTGGSALFAIEAAREAGANVVQVVTVLDRSHGKAAKLFKKTAGVDDFQAVLTLADLDIDPSKD